MPTLLGPVSPLSFLQPLGPALRVSSRVPMAAALLGAGNAMGTTTVQMGLTRWEGRPAQGKDGLGGIRAGLPGCPALTRMPARVPTERLQSPV